MRKIRMDEVCSFVSGYAWNSNDFNFMGNGLPIIRIQNIPYAPDDEFAYWSKGYNDKFIVSYGDLIVSLSGSIKVDIWKGPVSLLNQRIVKIECDPNLINKKYAFIVISNLLKEIEMKGNSSIINNVSINVLKELQIDVPSIEDQVEIVQILDKAQSLIDKRKQALARFDELIQAVFLDMFGDPVSNNRSWEKVVLNQFIDNIESGWSPVCKTIQASEDEWGVLKLSAITSGSFKASENKAISESTTPKPSIEVRVNDLLFVRKNTLDLVGTCAYVFETPSKLMLPDTIFRFVLREDSNMNKLFLWQLFNYPKYKKQIQKLAGGTAGSMPNISKSKLLNFEVIYPDTELQSKFSEIVHKIELQKRKQFQSLQQLESNFQALLQKAFKGELTVKDGVAV
ncbi:restriction endonuclease subunit S [Paenibacillus rhizolycopersici]|uniref:restriction endonuclease subunit S n=1 Tax=Paenibacillus rhizolycopersici TaxID=2780073 RepID=UPI003D26AAB7